MTTINQSTITRNGMTWDISALPKRLQHTIKEYGSDLVATVLTEGDYYPPMIDAAEVIEIDDRCTALYVSRTYVANPSVRPALERLGYTATEAAANL